MIEKKLDYYFVDVFTNKKFGGNPLAVVVTDGQVSSDTMLSIAKEINFSETTFLLSKPNSEGVYLARIFTPSREIAFAGHPIIGTAWVIKNVLREKSHNLAIEVGVGRISVRMVGQSPIFWFISPKIEIGNIISKELISKILNIHPTEISSEFPVQTIAAGVSAVIVPLSRLETLRKIKIDQSEYYQAIQTSLPTLIYCFTREASSNDFNIESRFFFEADGIREDAATGNGAAFLGAYVLNHQVFSGNEIDLKISQGFAMKRESTIYVSAKRIGEIYKIEVGGEVVQIAQGKIDI